MKDGVDDTIEFRGAGGQKSDEAKEKDVEIV